VLPEFQGYGAELVGISVDGVWCHQAFASDRNLHFPLLSNFEPKGAVAKRYGVYDDSIGECRHALFVIDGAGARPPLRESVSAPRQGPAEPRGGARLDVERFATLEEHAFEEQVRSDFLSGVRSGVSGTPTFFISVRRHNGPLRPEDASHSLRAA
jgi:AhpC/TSA family